MRYLPAIHELIGMLLMLVGVAVASDSKAETLWPALVGVAICAVGLAVGVGPSLLHEWRKTNDKTPE